MWYWPLVRIHPITVHGSVLSVRSSGAESHYVVFFDNKLGQCVSSSWPQFVPDAEPGISTDCPSISSWHEFSETISEVINGSLYKHFLYGPRVYFGCFLNLSGIDVKLIPWVTLWYWCHGLTTYLLYVSPLFGNRKLILITAGICLTFTPEIVFIFFSLALFSIDVVLALSTTMESTELDNYLIIIKSCPTLT